MRKFLIISTVIILSLLAGCNGGAKYLSVDFQKELPLKYKFVSDRDIKVVWEKEGSEDKRTQNIKERLELKMEYEPIMVNPYGLTKIKGTVQDVKVKRTQKKVPRDAAYSLKGKSFVLTVDATGKIYDYSELKSVIRESSKNAFRKSKKRGKVKNPDMLSDFLATQWFLWDSISSRPDPLATAEVGETWNSNLSMPLPMIMKKGRDVKYSIADINDTEQGRIAVINHNYSIAKGEQDWPMPWPGGFKMSSTFGFLRGYSIKDFEGGGKEIFNMDRGFLVKQNQQYKIKMRAYIPFTTKVKPMVYIDQKITMELIEPQKGGGEAK